MTAAVFFGCAFIAFGPALALYIFTIVTEPLRIIFLIIGAFFWLVSLLFSSFIWFTTATLIGNKDEPREKYLLIFGVLISVLIQEMFRFAYYKLLKKASEGLKTINPYEKAPSMRLLAYVSGLGFGIMSGVFSFVNTLSDSLGPGTVGIHGDPPQFFLYSGDWIRQHLRGFPTLTLHTDWRREFHHLSPSALGLVSPRHCFLGSLFSS
ncbi:gamma-secretase subunit APH-1B isoform X6 [Bubalus bubalis]|uniref:gamma-secretase subunit APH-1B isoform X6 n=1 Tax=Bubalus bubalis TaxID=89462 RepID=UPI001E1B76D7|nr:gamma-secretase subunit APH-1B isoform X6 [Bubalus bubalis]